MTNNTNLNRIALGNKYVKLLDNTERITQAKAEKQGLVPLSIGCYKHEHWILGLMLKDLLATEKKFACVMNNDNQLELWQTPSPELKNSLLDVSSTHFDLNIHKWQNK
jgi:hypothetical protein